MNEELIAKLTIMYVFGSTLYVTACLAEWISRPIIRLIVRKLTGKGLDQ